MTKTSNTRADEIRQQREANARELAAKPTEQRTPRASEEPAPPERGEERPSRVRRNTAPPTRPPHPADKAAKKGRPPKEAPRTRHLAIYITDEEWGLLKKCAQAFDAEMTVGAWARVMLLGLEKVEAARKA